MDCRRLFHELLVSSPCNALACGLGHLLSLEDNAQLLVQGMTELRDKREAMKSKVELAKARRQKPLPRVLSWLEQVDALDQEATRIESRLMEVGSNPLQACCSPFRLWLSFQLGKVAVELLQSAVELNSKGAGLRTVAAAGFCDPFADYDLECIPRIWCGGAFSSALEELHHALLQDDGTSFIAVHGPRGVGKTTLLRQLYYKLVEGETQTSWDFSTVILVTMSDNAALVPDINATQKQAMEQLGLWWNTDEDPHSRASKVREVVKHRKSVVLLDGVSGPVNLDVLGIPDLGATSKFMVIVASRDEEVCDKIKMSAHCKKVEMKPFAEDDAWALFQGIVGSTALDSHPEISCFAKTISDGCGGLPLALVTLGHHLSGKRTIQEWQQAATILKDRLSDAQGTDEKLFNCLEFVYNNLPNTATRSCFVYCSLFPQGYNIATEQLIEYWMGEGFLGECNGVDEARRSGLGIIQSLTSAGLLQTGVAGENAVRISGTNREFALRIASENGRNSKRYLLYHEMNEAPDVEDWREAKRVNFVESPIYEIFSDPMRIECPNLVTFLGRSESTRVGDFHASMPSLVVLELSCTHLWRFPTWVVDSVNLQYLNLSCSSVRALPKEMAGMMNLRVLDLSYTFQLRNIPAVAISRLLNLQLLNMLHCVYQHWDARTYQGNRDDGDTQLSFQDLEALQQLGELSLSFSSNCTLQEFLSCRSLLGITTRICLDGRGDLSGIRLLAMLKNLREIHVDRRYELSEWIVGPDITEVEDGPKESVIPLEDFSLSFVYDLRALIFVGSRRFQSLCSIDLTACYKMEHVVGLEQLPCLKSLVICVCPLQVLLQENTNQLTVEEEKEEEDKSITKNTHFPTLKKLVLGQLSEMKTISPRPLAFPCLETLIVYSCPKLMRLPLGPRSAMRMREIVGSGWWWHRLEWEDEITKMAFVSSFVEIDEW